MNKEKNTTALISIYYAAFGQIAGFVAAALAINTLHGIGEPSLQPRFISDSWWMAFMMLQCVCVVVISVVLFYWIGRFLARFAVRSDRRIMWLSIHLAVSAILMTSLAACVERWRIPTWILGTSLAVFVNWSLVVFLRRQGIV